MNDDEYCLRIRKFKSDLMQLDPVTIARKYIVLGDCAVIANDKYFKLRQIVSSKFDLHPNEVLVVGSGKLGFSIAPKKRYRAFGNTSDLDVVIVSDILFDTVWKDVHRYFTTGGYWEHQNEFIKFLFRGWVRPDKLPPDQRFDFARHWWDLFNELSASEEFSAARVRGAIYRSWHFLESYQVIAISDCVNALKNEE